MDKQREVGEGKEKMKRRERRVGRREESVKKERRGGRETGRREREREKIMETRGKAIKKIKRDEREKWDI